jgi:hypothetical protein
MRRAICHLVVVVSLAVALAVIPLSGCAGNADAGWKSPADEAELAKLETATLEKGLPRARRAQLFFLWGQELSEKDPDRAIGAFERVVDLGSIFVDESRFNLEILWRQKEQQSQNQQNQKNQQDQKNSQGQSGKDDQNPKDSQDQKGQQGKNGQQNQKDQQSGQNGQNKQDQNGQQSNADKSKPKDLSALVRDKEQSSDLDKALKAELERRNEQQTTQAGGVAPVEKDW